MGKSKPRQTRRNRAGAGQWMEQAVLPWKGQAKKNWKGSQAFWTEIDCCAPWVAETQVHLGKVQFPLDLGGPGTSAEGSLGREIDLAPSSVCVPALSLIHI